MAPLSNSKRFCPHCSQKILPKLVHVQMLDDQISSFELINANKSSPMVQRIVQGLTQDMMDGIMEIHAELRKCTQCAHLVV